jgi:hypothetical protein
MLPAALALRSLALTGLLLCAAPSQAATTVTVHNLTGRALAVSRPWHPWGLEPDDPPRSWHHLDPHQVDPSCAEIPAFRRWLRPGETGTYRFQLPGRDLEVDLVIRRLDANGSIHHDGLTIQAVDPDLDPPLPGPEPGIPDPAWPRVIGEDLPPEPEAKLPVPEPVICPR